MLSRVAAVMAGLVTITRISDTRRLDVRRVMARYRQQESFDDLARDSRLEHQERVDSDEPPRFRALLRRRPPRDRYVTDPGKFNTIIGRGR